MTIDFDNFGWYNFNMDTKIIERKLGNLIKSGHIPNRGNEALSDLCYQKINCFAYACFNMTNKMLEDLHWDDACAKALCLLSEPEQTLNFLAKTNLKVEPASGRHLKLANNQWKIAMFLGSGRYPDKYHYMLQLTDGSWAEKRGFWGPERFYDKMPKTTMGFYEEFKFDKKYIITNPYAQAEKE